MERKIKINIVRYFEMLCAYLMRNNLINLCYTLSAFNKTTVEIITFLHYYFLFYLLWLSYLQSHYVGISFYGREKKMNKNKN